MLACYTVQADRAIPLMLIHPDQFPAWLEKQSNLVSQWIKGTQFIAKPDTFCIVPGNDGHIKMVLVGVRDLNYFWNIGHLSTALPAGVYTLTGLQHPEQIEQAVIAWGLGAYQFTRYKKATKTIAQLVLPEGIAHDHVQHMVETISLVRDWINVPTEDMGPAELGEIATTMAKTFGASLTQTVGDELIAQRYPAIHAVGRASPRAPRLIDLTWGDPTHPKVTLLGKGVCFDTGGLDLKNAVLMQLMKKDMAGAAHALGLARLIMSAKLKMRLRVLIPAVENVVSGNAYKPGDVIVTRKGISVEVGNTDAEGRLILCDALAEACSEKPALILDFATLTGAARVAVGTEITALFSNHETLAADLLKHAKREQDPMWELPLYAPYRKLIDSNIADINNNGSSGYAGAITAALFLKEFVPDTIPWAHMDFMAWNLSSQPGRPEGGEAMALRAVFAYLQEQYS